MDKLLAGIKKDMQKFNILFLCIYLSVFQVNAQVFKGVVAHRAGIWEDKSLPENSIAAMNKCASIGVDVIEIDVHLTKDKIVVVNHDYDFLGMNIATNTFEDLKREGKLSNGESISSLEEYIKALKKHKHLKLWIDIKRSNVDMAWDVLAGEYVAKTILKTKSTARAEVIAPMFLTMVQIKMLAPELALHYIGTNYEAAALKQLGFRGVNLQYKRYAKEYDMQTLKDAGLKIGAYVVDDTLLMRELLDQGVDYITTNKPLLLLNLLPKK